MLSLQDLSRREWLRVGGLSAAGLTLPFHHASARSDSPAKACIFLFLGGGPPQHETWDPKPNALAEIRGEFQPIASSLPGLHVGELMPRTAAIAHKVCVLRAVSTNDNAHSASGYWVLTGHPHTPMNQESGKPGPPNDAPSLGAVVRHLHKDRAGIPASAILPEHIRNNPNNPWPGQFGGWLGRAADPWLLTCDPTTPQFNLPELALPGDVAPLRFDDRRSLLEQVNQHLNGMNGTPAVGKHAIYQHQALDLLRSPAARKAFDLDAEPAAVRDQYGRHKFGQSVLLARRLIEAGVTFVQVNWPREKGDENAGNPLWDTHQKNAERLKTVLMPQMDQTYPALLKDLDQRGLLESTVVVWIGEFGRTPKINGAGGRDHWGHVFSAALAGGGIRGGQVIGSSDKIGGHPKDGRVEPHDIHATILHCLGYGSETTMRDVEGRQIPATRGTVIHGAV
jgi:Protein of unknown function (DUF1501)